MAAANTKSKNSSVQPGRRECRSWAGQIFGVMSRRGPMPEVTLTIAERAANPVDPALETMAFTTF
jgi:hypothetical protein